MQQTLCLTTRKKYSSNYGQEIFLQTEITLSLLLIQTHYTADILPQLGGRYSVRCDHLFRQIVSHSVENRPSATQAIQLCRIVLYGPTSPSVGADKQCDIEQFLIVGFVCVYRWVK